MYRCDGCGRGVLGKAGDPIHCPGSRKLCTKCLGIEVTNSLKQTAQPVSEDRAAAGRARWAAMTPEEKAAQVARLQANRKPRAPRAAAVSADADPTESPPTTGRGAAARSRWAGMSEEDRAARVARMQAGRKAARAAAPQPQA